MSNWDESKHKVFAKKAVTVSDSTKIVVERYSYDDGPVKIGLRMKITKKDKSVVYGPFRGGVEPEIAIKLARLMKKLANEEE